MQRPWRFANLSLIVLSIALAACFHALPVVAQQGLPEAPQPQPGQKNQPLPDAPRTSNPLSGAPVNPSDQAHSQTGEASSADTGGAPAIDAPAPAANPAPVGHVAPSNRAANAPSSGYDETSFVIKRNVNAVPVQVTVKDAAGHLFPGLTKDNFSVYENGEKQTINFFTSDPFPVSAAIIIDVGMPEVALRRIKETFPALVGAFSQFDELAVYTYGTTVRQQQDYMAALGDTTTATMKRIEQVQGGNGGAGVYNPMTVGPTVNGRVFDPGTQRNQVEYAPPKNEQPSSVLNDAVMRAAQDLGRREKARRHVIFILSDGFEYGSKAKYSDVLAVLQKYNVAVYGVENDVEAIPGYKKLTKFHLPTMGYRNVLTKYASATGGEIFSEFNSQALESAYGAAMEEGRSQYTLVYNAPNTASANYRRIEVRVNGYGPSLKVYARAGYYPTPPSQ
jgi:VWFA-related protein